MAEVAAAPARLAVDREWAQGRTAIRRTGAEIGMDAGHENAAVAVAVADADTALGPHAADEHVEVAAVDGRAAGWAAAAAAAGAADARRQTARLACFDRRRSVE